MIYISFRFQPTYFSLIRKVQRYKQCKHCKCTMLFSEFRTRQMNSQVEKMCEWCISTKTETKVFMAFHNNYKAQIKDLDSVTQVLCPCKVISTNPAHQLQKFLLISVPFQLDSLFFESGTYLSTLIKPLWWSFLKSHNAKTYLPLQFISLKTVQAVTKQQNHILLDY